MTIIYSLGKTGFRTGVFSLLFSKLVSFCFKNMQNFRALKVWQKGMEVVKMTYQLSALLPASERFGLTSQMRRCAVSIPSNIAEGCGRSSGKDFNHFLDIALGSSFELETQILIMQGQLALADEQVLPILDRINEVQRMLKSFKQKLIGND